jgi:hypothetical protein
VVTATPVKLLSNSEAQTWKTCRRAWYLRWHRRLTRDREAVTGPLALGTKVHLALATHYSPSDDRDPLAVLRDAYAADMVLYPDEAADLQKDLDLAYAMVEGYLEWLVETGADEWFEVVGEEVPFDVPLSDGVGLLGRLDLVIRRRSDGALAALDQKTAAELTSPLKTIHLNEQGRTYALLLKLTYPDAPVAGAVWSWLRKTKRTARANPPFYAREELWYTEVELRNFYTRLTGTARDIVETGRLLDAGGDPLFYAYPTPSTDCAWRCEFFTVCPMFDDGSHVEGVLGSAFVERDPYDRYQGPAL